MHFTLPLILFTATALASPMAIVNTGAEITTRDPQSELIVKSLNLVPEIAYDVLDGIQLASESASDLLDSV